MGSAVNQIVEVLIHDLETGLTVPQEVDAEKIRLLLQLVEHPLNQKELH